MFARGRSKSGHLHLLRPTPFVHATVVESAQSPILARLHLRARRQIRRSPVFIRAGVWGRYERSPVSGAILWIWRERERGGEGVNSLVKICTKTDTRQVKETIPLATTCLA
jgi:hypothetical protein